MGKPYTQAELDFIKAHADMRPRELAELFNATFGKRAEPKRMSMYLRRYGIEPNIRREHHYTDEQRKWLAENAANMSERDITVAFNAKFGTTVNKDALRAYVKRDIRVSRTKEAASQHRSQALRRFQPGDTSIHKRGGRRIKVILTNNYKWIPYGRYLWEQEHGALPAGWTVIFLNNDGTDCRLENIYAIGADVMVLMARNQWFSTNPDVTMTAIKLCQLARVSNGQIRV